MNDKVRKRYTRELKREAVPLAEESGLPSAP
jgi:transposase-like protein